MVTKNNKARRTVRNSGKNHPTNPATQRNLDHNTSHKGGFYDHETHMAEIPLVLHLYR